MNDAKTSPKPNPLYTYSPTGGQGGPAVGWTHLPNPQPLLLSLLLCRPQHLAALAQQSDRPIHTPSKTLLHQALSNVAVLQAKGWGVVQQPPTHAVHCYSLTGCSTVPTAFWEDTPSRRTLMSLCSSLASEKKRASSAKGSGTSRSPSRLKPGHLIPHNIRVR